MPEPTDMGRFSVEFVVANNRDVVNLRVGDRALLKERVKHLVLTGVVEGGASRLVLPQRVVDELDLQVEGETSVRYADDRREKRPLVGNVWLELLGRHGVFSAVIERNRKDALIGAIVFEELDLLVDCVTQSLHPREPDAILTDIE